MVCPSAALSCFSDSTTGWFWTKSSRSRFPAMTSCSNPSVGDENDVAEKWDPQTRETADHSLAYLAAVALTDGAVTLDSYRPERIRDAATLRPLMRKITIVEDPATRGLPPGRQPVDVVVVLRNGKVVQEHCEFPRGHVTKPPTSEAVDDKFMELAGRVLDTANGLRDPRPTSGSGFAT